MKNAVNQRFIKRALISVTEKVHIVDFARQLRERHVEIIATDGTAKLLKKHQIAVTDVSAYTGFPEILDGRVKTLHPKIYGGLLSRSGVDEDVLKQYAMESIDLLVVNLYQFIKNVSSHRAFEKSIEQIDIGGHSLLRAGVKNFKSVTVVVDPNDYSLVLQEMDTHFNTTSLSTRRTLAKKTLEYLLNYDSKILSSLQAVIVSSSFPSKLPITVKKKKDLCYGENPHQIAALYSTVPPLPNSLTSAQQLHGKPLSFNNLLDGDCAYRTVWEAQQAMIPTCAIVKHATPCGVAQGKNQLIAYEKAYSTDPLSAFGGVIAFNSTVEIETAKILRKKFIEVIIAPSFTIDALEILKKKPNLRLLKVHPFDKGMLDFSFSFHSIIGGLLVQKEDTAAINFRKFTVVSQRYPSKKELQDLYFAWKIVKHVKSNAIVCTKNTATLGIGSGQSSRIFAVKIAIMKAQEAGLSLENSVMASDAFFPFIDSVEIAEKNGISAIIQPGGSIRDKEIIQTTDKAKIAMVFTHQRHFRH
ncbi:bifunctional phosphoribosylaminoimidazolecarboxamide formyltransferase/IMP cyclohydrolase [Coxiella endosymbiont of Amblyomma americanum]|uniref:bifunctional phosphoribosylaminoimidazolecarboxamide formyltransferase/IMP cyclohydrolase n=1 Tax=Coxiella endosymbiont of Amblyomma americanum TaxID=325775 RepID=UPI00057FC23E|nr:bifunctional phosphoribosylaminoimidazolecarboxamide formyltransferase/IMP cyclohydrolase [Coxiella endosymbiont of Amblyomma americanum]AJC50475.1 phosphoribosylaminoimidazolecarboxamide formyltransferase [Coxiella endosymbiont of Amblyomma americanum]AUJ58815.1 bifunctional phosphoribosylaminoimidazolecarboxamide formyltransferase/inosine monophosphate cyclohydrolase [Coxiella-like endosymbiont of Amblyomma americanum]